MKKYQIGIIVILFFLWKVSNIYAQPVVKYGSSYKEFKEGNNVLLSLNNGKTYYCNSNKQGLLLRIFDSENKLINEKNIIEGVKYKLGRSIVGFHEINNKAVLFLQYYMPDYSLKLIGLMIDTQTDELAEEILLAQIQKQKDDRKFRKSGKSGTEVLPSFRVRYDKDTEMFVVIRNNTYARNINDRLAISLFNNQIESVYEVKYPFPNKVLYNCMIIDVALNGTKELYIASKVYISYGRDAKCQLYLSKYDFNSKRFKNKLLSSGKPYEHGFVKMILNKKTNKLVVLASYAVDKKRTIGALSNKTDINIFHSSSQSNGSFLHKFYYDLNVLFFYFIDPATLAIKFKNRLNSPQTVLEYSEDLKSNGDSDFRGLLHGFVLNEDGTYTILVERWDPGGFNSKGTKLLSIMHWKIKPDGSIKYMNLFPKKQAIFSDLISRKSTKFFLFRFVHVNGSDYLIYNDLKGNFDATSERSARVVSTASLCRTFYIKVKPDGSYKKDFLFGNPNNEGKKFFNPALFRFDGKGRITTEIIDIGSGGKVARLVHIEMN